jgi:Uma2 family endonuclease
MVARLNFISPEEYLALERKAEYKSEYINGQMYAMAGGTKRHNRIAGNVFTLLHTLLSDKPCDVFNSDMKVRVPSSLKFHYPDISVACGESVYADDEDDVLLTPILLVEILSESTSAYDRGKKFQYYQEIESFREYLLVAQDEPVVERFVKQSDGNWLYTKVAGMDENIELVALNCRLALRDIYAKVNFSQ